MLKPTVERTSRGRASRRLCGSEGQGRNHKGAGATKRRSAPQKPLGRPSEFSAEVERAILDALAAGASVASACEAAGVGRTTYNRWLEQGEPEDGPEHFRDFRDATTRARAQARVAYAAVIRRAATDGDWKAAAWALERLEPEEWALKRRLEHTGPGGSAIRHETVPDYSDPKVREAADVLLGRIEISDETRAAIREAGRRRARDAQAE